MRIVAMIQVVQPAFAFFIPIFHLDFLASFPIVQGVFSFFAINTIQHIQLSRQTKLGSENAPFGAKRRQPVLDRLVKRQKMVKLFGLLFVYVI